MFIVCLCPRNIVLQNIDGYFMFMLQEYCAWTDYHGVSDNKMNKEMMFKKKSVNSNHI